MKIVLIIVLLLVFVLLRGDLHPSVMHYLVQVICRGEKTSSG